MKWILGLLIGMLIASPAFGQLTRAEAQTLLTGFAQLTAEVKEIKVEIATVKANVAVVKADIAVMKTDIAELKTDVAVMKNDIAELKTDVAVMKNDITASEEKTSAEIRGLTRQLSFVQFLLGILVTGLLTVLLAFLKQQWDKRKEGDEKLGAQQKELADKQSEIDALRAENERMKNTSGLVSPSGGRLENEGERERA